MAPGPGKCLSGVFARPQEVKESVDAIPAAIPPSECNLQDYIHILQGQGRESDCEIPQR